ncbi:hypothetical protein JG688_00009492 [Phytophthora aleatoria]|uniref:Uncharacterized protein n=1 Tax=Phytophthora aleatoria TaxID=2496075 RepID=A0A8J5J5Y0_9STRA|nr:hypothetical protein JG688_00009492 [Phytophthora aleatoria]
MDAEPDDSLHLRLATGLDASQRRAAAPAVASLPHRRAAWPPPAALKLPEVALKTTATLLWPAKYR